MFETIQLPTKSDPSHKLVNVGQIIKSIQLQLQYIQLEIPVIIGDKPTYPSMGHHFAHRHLMPSLSFTKSDGLRSSDKRARFHRLHVRVKMLPKWCTWCWKMLKIYEHVMIQDALPPLLYNWLTCPILGTLASVTPMSISPLAWCLWLTIIFPAISWSG